MPLADTFARAYQVRGQMDQMEERRRKRESEQSIQDLYGSGQPVDDASIQKLLASGADPASVLSISKLMRGDRVDNARVANLESQVKVRESPMVAGALKMPYDAWKAKPPEEQTQAEWEKWKATGRKLLASNGMDPDLVPVDADPGFIEAQIGAGYAPGSQDLTMDRRDENVARQGRFETSQEGIDARFGISQAGLDTRNAASIGAANQRSSLNRSAADARTARTGGGGGAKQTQFERDMAQLTPEEAKKALLVKYKLEQAPGGGDSGSGRGTTAQTQTIKNLQKYRDFEANTQQLVDATDSLDADIAERGTETDIPIIGSPGASVQKTRYADVMSGIQKIREMGVLQPGEFPFLEMAVKNPTTFVNALQGENVRAQLAELKAQAGRAMKRAETRLLSDPAQPPGATPSRAAQGQPDVAGVDPERAELEQLRARKAAAMAGR